MKKRELERLRDSWRGAQAVEEAARLRLQRAAAAAIESGASKSWVAATVGVTRMTLDKWLRSLQ